MPVRPDRHPAVILVLIKLVPIMRKLAKEREQAEDTSSFAGCQAAVEAQAAEIARMTARIDKLENEQVAERERHATEVGQLAASHEAELGLHRHIARNAKQVLYSFLDLIEAKPDDAAATAAKIRRRMEKYERQEADEAARIHGARIIAAATPAAVAPNVPTPAGSDRPQLHPQTIHRKAHMVAPPRVARAFITMWQDGDQRGSWSWR